MKTGISKLWGVGILAILIIIFGPRPAAAETADEKVVWKQVQEGEWSSVAMSLGGPVRLSYRKADGIEEFTVTLPCLLVNRTYRVSWRRNDSAGTVPIGCDGRYNADWPIDHVRSLFKNLPDGAPPEKPAEVYTDDFYTKVIV